MSTLTPFDADPDLRTTVQRIADCARHQGSPAAADYLTLKLARLEGDAVGAGLAESERPAPDLASRCWYQLSGCELYPPNMEDPTFPGIGQLPGVP